MSRFGYVLVTAITGQLAVALACVNPSPRLVWNVTASAPTGLYGVSPGKHATVGELVLLRPDPVLAQWLARRHYVPLGVPLIKHVAAIAGQNVCRTGSIISIDGLRVATARDRDRKGRALPIWSGCRSLRPGDVMLLNKDVEDSLDGRYFGPVSRSDLIGTMQPIFTRAAPGAAMIWLGWRP